MLILYLQHTVYLVREDPHRQWIGAAVDVVADIVYEPEWS